MDVRLWFDNPMRGVSRARRRSIGRALRSPRVLTDPDDAEALVRFVRWQRRLVRSGSSPVGRIIRFIGFGVLLAHSVRLALDGSSLDGVGLGVVGTGLLIAIEIASAVWHPRSTARVDEAEQLNAAFLDSIGRPVAPDPPPPTTRPSRLAIASVAAFPASFVFVVLAGAVEGDDPTKTDIIAATALGSGLGGLTCAAGLMFGLRARAERARGDRTVATAGAILSAVGLALYTALAVAVVVTEF